MNKNIKVCIITMVKDDHVFFPMWKKYYSQYFSPRDMFVFDNDSDPEFRRQHMSDMNVFHVPSEIRNPGKFRNDFYKNPGFDSARANLISKFCNGLLAYYDRVIYTDADEFLIPSAAYDHSLSTFFEQATLDPFEAPLGINLTHLPDLEPAPLDLTRPVLSQRRYVNITYGHSKPTMRSRQAMWSAGFHGLNKPFSIRNDLFLFHLRDMDVDLRWNNHEKRHQGFVDFGKGDRSSWKFKPKRVLKKYHERLSEAEMVDQDFTTVDSCFTAQEVRPGLYRAAPENGEILRGRKFDHIYTVPDSFSSLL